MIQFKSLLTAALLSTIAAAGFAQSPSPVTNDSTLNPPAVVSAPSGRAAKPVTQKPKHQVKKRHAKQHVAKRPKGATSAKKAHKASIANSKGPGKEAF